MLKTIDLFAGAGGLSLGFKQTGHFKLVAAAEIKKYARETYSHNIPNPGEEFVFIENVVGYDFRTLSRRFGGIDVVSMAEMYAPTGEIRITNPADFELPFYAEIQNESFSLNFEEEQEDEDSELEDEASCVYWEEATPILKQVAAVAYRTAKSELNVDTEAFEVSYNGPEDWYYPLEK